MNRSFACIFLAAAAAGALCLSAPAPADGPDFRSASLGIGFRAESPAFGFFSVDALGRGELGENPILQEPPPPSSLRLERKGGTTFVYAAPAAASAGAASRAVWTVECADRSLTLRSDYVPGVEASPFVLAFDQKANHVTLLGLMKAGECRMSLPCVLHMPDRGSVRISSDAPGAAFVAPTAHAAPPCGVAVVTPAAQATPPCGGALDYDARRYVKTPFVRVAFPPATSARPRVTYTLEVAEIHPDLPGIAVERRYDGFRRSFLNIFQVNPRVQMLANNASSDPVPFTVYMCAMVAEAAPPLAPGLTALDLVRMTVDRYLAGAKGYGLVGYAVAPPAQAAPPCGDADLVAWKAPWNSLDTYPSLLQAACTYALAARDLPWARANFDKLSGWAWEMMAGDRNGDGLIEHPHTGNSGDRATADKRPSNWWDTINFGHDDAYSNALAYKACLQFSELANALGRAEEARAYAAKAARLKAAYKGAFLNPATGLLAGWRSLDGKLHDYAFTFVNGIAVCNGLLEGREANAVMDRLLAKMEAVGFTNFRLGLPGNLVPVRKEDYVFHNWAGSRAFGEPFEDDGRDAFQLYENGGATACYAYFTVKALYALGRVADARRIFLPMLDGFAAGEFQGFCADGKSRDWRDWNGGCHGYEGLLCDGYLTLLCALDEARVKK